MSEEPMAADIASGAGVTSASKRRLGRRRYLIIVATIVLLFVAIAAVVIEVPRGMLAPTPAYPVAPAGPRPTVLLIHGYGFFNSCPSDNGAVKWAAVFAFLQARGWQDIKRLGYYVCDTNQDAYIDNFGRFPQNDTRNYQEYYDTSPCSCTTFQESADHGLASTKDTDIRNLAYHLAWYIWDTYAQYGKPVVIVAHSMAGLIVRWMLYAIANPASVGEGVFPPQVYIPQIVTLSAPNAGLTFISDGLTTYQTQEMDETSAFMQELDTNALDPEATGGTDWTLIGNYPSDTDLVVSAASATAMDHVHRVLYYGVSAYSHNSILNDSSTQRNASVYRCDLCLHTARIVNGDFTRYTNMPHSLDYINAALSSNAW